MHTYIYLYCETNETQCVLLVYRAAELTKITKKQQ